MNASENTLIDTPKDPIATLILAHGSGSPMDHSTMNELTYWLNKHHIEVMRFEFDYMAQRRSGGSRRPPPAMNKIIDEWEHKLRHSEHKLSSKPLFIGGKSMGGRAASLLNTQCDTQLATKQLPAWHGTICVSYPFHPTSQPNKLRTEHLHSQQRPLFIAQGTRDSFGSIEEVAGYNLPVDIELHWIETGNHDLKPLKRSGQTHANALSEAALGIATFMCKVLKRSPHPLSASRALDLK